MIKKNFKKLKIEYEEPFELTEECFDPLVVDVAVTLLKHILRTGEIITYGELSRLMSNPINPRNLDRPLGVLSDACKENGLPLLSVMVVNSDSYIPGAGFFRYFFPDLKSEEWDEKFVELYNQVKEYSNWRKVLDAFTDSDLWG